MEEKKEIFDGAEQTFELLIDLKNNFPRPALGPSLFNIFESVSKFNEENKNFILNLYKPYESIYADVISSFENPDCQCRKRFMDFIENNIEISKNVFFSLLAFLSSKDSQNILDRLKSFYNHYKILSEEQNAKPKEGQNANSDNAEKNEEGGAGPSPGVGEQSAILSQDKLEGKKKEAVHGYNFTESESYSGKSFIIEKTQEAYSNFFENLSKNKVQYNGLSIIPFNLKQMMVLFY